MNVKSETDPTKTYTVQVHEGVGLCNCQGYTTHGHCKHVAQALREAGYEDEETALATIDPAQPPRALILNPPAALLPTRDEVSLIGAIANTIIKASGHAIPSSIDSPVKAVAVMLAGWEMGLRPMTALRHVFVVNGRTEPDAQAMMGVVRAKDPTARFVFDRYDAEAVRVTLFRRGMKIISVEYTKADAKASGQLDKSGPWKQYTRDMLAWSAVKRACRLGAPDLINSIPSVSLGDVDGMGVEDEAPFVEMPSRKPESAASEFIVDTATGERIPYDPMANKAADPTRVPRGFDDYEPEPAQPNWSEFWAYVQKTLRLSREQAHAHFGVPAENGALNDYARERAEDSGLPLGQVMAEMREELRQAVATPGLGGME